MKRKKSGNIISEGTAATVPGMAANSAEFVPGSMTPDENDFVNTLNQVYDFIPDMKPEKYGNTNRKGNKRQAE